MTTLNRRAAEADWFFDRLDAKIAEYRTKLESEQTAIDQLPQWRAKLRAMTILKNEAEEAMKQ